MLGAVVMKWLSFWLAEKEVRGSIPSPAATISKIGHLPLPSRDIAEISLKRRKSSTQPTNQPSDDVVVIPSLQLQQPVLARVTT